MSCRKRRRWHFRDPKCKNFWGACLQTPLGLGCLRHTNFSTLSITGFSWLTKSMPMDGKRDSCSRRGWRGGCILKIVIAKRVQFSYVILLSLFFGGRGGAKFRYTTCHATLLERSIVWWPIKLLRNLRRLQNTPKPNGLVTQRPWGQLVGQNYWDNTTLASKTWFSHQCFGFQSLRFSLLEGYNIIIA